MGDSAIAVIAIFLAAILMFVFPLMTITNEKDKTTATQVATITTEFVDTIRTTGKLTQDQYDRYLQTLVATGNSYDVDIKIKVSDDNPAKKEVTTNYGGNIGENVYYTMHTTQVLDAIKGGKVLTLSEGDEVSVTAKNTNVTIGMQLRNFLYKITGNNSSTISASSVGIVTTSGK